MRSWGVSSWTAMPEGLISGHREKIGGQKMAKNEMKRITWLWNGLLLLHLLCVFAFKVAFSEEAGTKSLLWDEWYGSYPTLTYLGTIVVPLYIFVIGGLCCHLFWNRIISDVFKVRRLEVRETAFILLLISSITTWVCYY
jgi:hypothetical protein